MRRFASFLLLALVAAPSLAHAQSQAINGTIEGVVRDTTGDVLPGATVTITNVETGAQRSVQSASDGSYRAPLLPLGSYTVKAEITGFKTLERTGISLSAGQTAVVDMTLEVGGIAEVVSVSGDSPVAQPGKIDLGRTISQAEIKNLPLVSRNPYNFAFLQANVTGYENNEFGVPRINANGSQMHTNYQIDGNTNTQKDRAGLRMLPISEVVVREVKVITSGFAPEFGQTTGMVFNAVTPSGTNDMRGYLTYRFRRAGMNERPFFLSPAARTPDNNIDNFTATLGGPIVSDRWHYYLGYEYVDQDLRDRVQGHPAERGQQRPGPRPVVDRDPAGRRHPHQAARQLRDRQDRLPDLPGAQALRALLLLQEQVPLQHRRRPQHRRARHRLQRPDGLGLRPADLVVRRQPSERAARAVRAPPPVPDRERERRRLPGDRGERRRRTSAARSTPPRARASTSARRSGRSRTTSPGSGAGTASRPASTCSSWPTTA